MLDWILRKRVAEALAAVGAIVLVWSLVLGIGAKRVAETPSVDRGQFGIDAPLNALDAQGIAHAGTARSAAEAKRITTIDVHGVKVAFLAYAYGDNGLPLPHPWADNIISLQRIVSDARRARRQGAQLIIVNFHWGDQY